jgi:hypothetical protein
VSAFEPHAAQYGRISGRPQPGQDAAGTGFQRRVAVEFAGDRLGELLLLRTCQQFRLYKDCGRDAHR